MNQNQESKMSIIPFDRLLNEACKLNGEYPTLIVFVDKTRHITTLMNFMSIDSPEFVSMVENLIQMKIDYEINKKSSSSQGNTSTPHQGNEANGPNESKENEVKGI